MLELYYLLVAQKQKNSGADTFFIGQREKSGANHIYRKESFDKMYEILEKKKIWGWKKSI